MTKADRVRAGNLKISVDAHAFSLTRQMSCIRRDETSNLFTLASDYDRESILLILLITYRGRLKKKIENESDPTVDMYCLARDVITLASGRMTECLRKIYADIVRLHDAVNC